MYVAYTHRDELNLRNWPTKAFFHISIIYSAFSPALGWCCLLGHLKLKWAFTMHTSQTPATIAMAASDFKNLCKSWFLLSFSFLFSVFFSLHSFCYCLFNASFWCVSVCVLLQHLAFVLFKQTNETLAHFRFLMQSKRINYSCINECELKREYFTRDCCALSTLKSVVKNKYHVHFFWEHRFVCELMRFSAIWMSGQTIHCVLCIQLFKRPLNLTESIAISFFVWLFTEDCDTFHVSLFFHSMWQKRCSKKFQ